MMSLRRVKYKPLISPFDGWRDDTFDYQSYINHLLFVGLSALKLDVAIFARVEGQKYTVEYCIGDQIVQGQEFDLQDTYCSITLLSTTVFSIANASASKYVSHPCYQLSRLESYIGIPIMLNQKIYGTISFSGFSSRKYSFDYKDKFIVKLIGESINANLMINTQTSESNR